MDEDDDFKEDEDMKDYNYGLPDDDTRAQKDEITQQIIERIVNQRIKEKEEEIIK